MECECASVWKRNESDEVGATEKACWKYPRVRYKSFKEKWEIATEGYARRTGAHWNTNGLPCISRCHNIYRNVSACVHNGTNISLQGIITDQRFELNQRVFALSWNRFFFWRYSLFLRNSNGTNWINFVATLLQNKNDAADQQPNARLVYISRTSSSVLFKCFHLTLPLHPE